MNQYRYSDLDQSLKTQRVYDIDSIKQSVKNILLTRKGTRLFNKDFGTNLDDYLFEIMDELSAFSLMDEIVKSLSKWEPRVYVDQGNSTISPDPLNHKWTVNLLIVVRDLGSSRFKLELDLKR